MPQDVSVVHASPSAKLRIGAPIPSPLAKPRYVCVVDCKRLKGMISSNESEDTVGLRVIHRGAQILDRARDVKDMLSGPPML
ncbi:hypothetical protein KY284_035938 [Solanum tuberosum]|nr:hypothetical protein KY284_035938 [Solanum tuberosum]